MIVTGKKQWLGAAILWAAVASPAVARDPQSLHDALGAPDELTIRASVRARTEGIDGQFRAVGPDDDVLVSFRSLIFAEYDAGPFRIGGELRDARGYFQKRNSSARSNEINPLEPLQAYLAADLDGAFGTGSTASLTAGRFTMDIGSGRLVAAPDFINSVPSFTGARFDWRSAGKDRVTLFWTLPSTRLPFDIPGLLDNDVRVDRARSSLRFMGGDAMKADILNKIAGEAYVYHLKERDSFDQPTRDRRLLTYGIRLFRPAAVGTIDLEVEVAHQTGHARATTAATDRADLNVDAGFAHAEVGQKLKGRWSPRVSLHADYASGDDADPLNYTRFDTLYGQPRVDFGPTGLYGAAARANLLSGGVRVDVAPSPRVDGFVMGRALWLDSATDSFGSSGVRDVSGRSGRYAGTQAEVRARYWLVPKRLRMDVGGAYLAKGDFLRVAPNAPRNGDTRYGYVDLLATF